MPVDRVTRLNAQLQKEISMIFEVLVRPAVTGALVTVTGVEIASNLRNANVYVSVYGSPVMKSLVSDVLKRKRAAIQSAVSKKVVMKYTPVLNFKLDDTAERADRVMNILKELDINDSTPAQNASNAENAQETTDGEE